MSSLRLTGFPLAQEKKFIFFHKQLTHDNNTPLRLPAITVNKFKIKQENTSFLKQSSMTVFFRTGCRFFF